MAQQQIFALPEDMLHVFELVEARHSLRYTLTGLFASAQVTSVLRGADIPSLHLPAANTSTLCPSYLVTHAQANPSVRGVPQQSGAVLYAIDQLQNPDSTVLTHGGLFSSDVLISGRVGTGSTSLVATQLQSSFATAITKVFTRVNAFYVGPEAVRLFQRGCRLTANVFSPAEYNLAVRA